MSQHTTKSTKRAPRMVNGVTITRDISSVRKAHEAGDLHLWFSPDTMRFFRSRVGSEVYGARYFVTSEQGPSGVRAYTVREIADDGTIETVGEFQEHSTRAQAHAAARRLAQA